MYNCVPLGQPGTAVVRAEDAGSVWQLSHAVCHRAVQSSMLPHSPAITTNYDINTGNFTIIQSGTNHLNLLEHTEYSKAVTHFLPYKAITSGQKSLVSFCNEFMISNILFIKCWSLGQFMGDQ